MAIVRVNPKKPERKIIERAAKIIKKGGLVAFPTETVYGLGANALNKKAVKKIFEVKKRPLDNPIIVHIADFKNLKKLAKRIPKEAEILAKKFWPGPLTFVLFKKKIVPNEVTGGQNTVAIRMPKNKIALELIKKSGVPIAAPSANLAGRPSPTEAKHVFEDFGEKIDLILDGGKTKIGVESTVLDLTKKSPEILRPGGASFEELKKNLPNLRLHPSLLGKKLRGKPKSPGMRYRHYAPKAELILAKNSKEIKKLIKKYKKFGKKIGVMASTETKDEYSGADFFSLSVQGKI
jgi:L-threonylcarbamoyladenylate synthase